MLPPHSAFLLQLDVLFRILGLGKTAEVLHAVVRHLSPVILNVEDDALKV